MGATTLSMVEELAKGLRTSRNVNNADLASFVIVYFDWFLTLDSEIKLIWNANGVKMKVLYLSTRYLPLVYFPLFLPYHFQNNFSDSECTTLYRVVATLLTIAALCSVLVVVIRTWAVWAKAKHMTYLLFGTFAMVSSLILVLVIISLKYTSHPPVFNGHPLGCIPKYGNLYLPAALVVKAVYDTITLVLMLIRGASLYRWGRDSRLFQTLYRDGIMFYIYITTVSIVDAALLFSQSMQGNYYVILLPLQGALCSVLACRAVLHVRLQYDELRMNTVPTNKGTHTTMIAGRDGIELQDVCFVGVKRG